MPPTARFFLRTMSKMLRFRTLRYQLLGAFAATVLLIAIRHYNAANVNLVDAIVLAGSALLTFFFYLYTTRRERLTRRVIAKEKELNQYLAAIPEGVIVVDTEQRVIFLNDVGQKLLRVPGIDDAPTVADWAGYFRISDAETRQLYPLDALPLNRALRAEVVTDTLLLTDSTGERYVESHARPLYNREEDLVGAIAIFRDVSEIRQREQALQQARLVAEQALRERELFIANISHEIRTPLNAILGFSELLDKRISDPEKRSYLEGIQTSGQNLLALIDDLLTISELESGQFSLTPVPTRLADVVRAVSERVQPRAEAGGLRYEVSGAEFDQSVLADGPRLVRVLGNLGDNAVKFTPKGTVGLTVRVHAAEAGWVRATFAVSDTGIGIDEKEQSSIFDRFTQLASDRLHRSGGTGLGLNIARQLVELMGGSIAVESRTGRGTTFTVQLPLALVPAPPEVATKRSMAPGDMVSPDFRVLVVEDNRMNQRVVEAFLQRNGLQPRLVGDGVQALRVLEKEPFDLIFMDIQMPNMDGYTATRLIRSQLGLSTPVVAMTAYSMAGERERCLEAGMNEYLAKPVSMQQVNELLRIFAPSVATRLVTGSLVEPVSVPEELVHEAYLMEVTDGDADLLNDMLAAFRQDLVLNRDAMLRAVGVADNEGFNRLAHRFRSSLSALALLKTAEQFKHLEETPALVLADEKAHVLALFEEIGEGIRALEALIEKGKLPATPISVHPTHRREAPDKVTLPGSLFPPS